MQNALARLPLLITPRMCVSVVVPNQGLRSCGCQTKMSELAASVAEESQISDRPKGSPISVVVADVRLAVADVRLVATSAPVGFTTRSLLILLPIFPACFASPNGSLGEH